MPYGCARTRTSSSSTTMSDRYAASDKGKRQRQPPIGRKLAARFRERVVITPLMAARVVSSDVRPQVPISVESRLRGRVPQPGLHHLHVQSLGDQHR